MKKWVFLASLLMASNSFADELYNFHEIKTAIITGKTPHIVVDFAKCSTMSKNNLQSIMVGGFTPNAIHVSDDHIATSLTHFTLNNPSFPQKPVYEFVRYTIKSDNNVNIAIQILDPVSYKSLSDTLSVDCKLNTSVKVYI